MLSKIVFIGCTMLAAVSGTTSGRIGSGSPTCIGCQRQNSDSDTSNFNAKTRLDAIQTELDGLMDSLPSVVASQIASSDLKGAKGDRGDRGDRGDNSGLRGPKGDKGEKGDRGKRRL